MMEEDGPSDFQETYHCLPATALPSPALRQTVEYGGKAIMPASALEALCKRLQEIALTPLCSSDERVLPDDVWGGE